MKLSSQQIRRFLDEDLAVDTAGIDDETLLFSEGVIDSFALVSLIAFLESEGDFRMSPLDVNLENLDSIERMLRFLESVAPAA